MELQFTKVEVGKSKPQKTLAYPIFKYYFEVLGYTRKEFTTKLGVNHRVFTVGLKAYYSPEKIEELRRNKIVKSNVRGRIKKWEDKLKDIEILSPGFTSIFEGNIKDNPEYIMRALIELNDKFYRAKLAMRPIKKYTNQAISRKGGSRVNLVGNGLEARVKFILDELGITYHCQFPVGKYFFDFRVSNTLIEVDGKQYHDNSEKDEKKQKFAEKKGYTIIRLTEEQIKKEPLYTKRCLSQLR